MKKINRHGFFLVETMVVIAVVGVVLTFLFKTFSTVYTRFSASEYYNTVTAINAASYVKQYIDKSNIAYEDLLGANAFVELTGAASLVNEYYSMLKEKLDISKIYLINIQTFFADETNINSFNINFRGYLNTLSDDSAQYKIVVINGKNEYGSIAAFDYYLTLTGDANDEYALYVPLNGTFVEPGYESKDNDGNNLDTIITGVVDTTNIGTYYLNYSVGAITLRRKIVVYKSDYTFDYTGNYQTFVVPVTGKYKVELWGAQVPSGNGKGAYTKGEIYLYKGQTFYVYVGESKGTSNSESFNGSIGSGGAPPGGGATDIRLISGNWKDVKSLRSRIMVAAGAGAGNIVGSHGGTLTGRSVGVATGGSQTTPGTTENSYYPALFGVGGGGCGGGGGYYGGGGATCASGGAGGSSFISARSGCDAILEDGTNSGQPNHYNGYRFINTEMIAGDTSMPNPRGAGNITGNNGAGYAKITLLSLNSIHNLQKVRYIYTQTNGNSVNSSNYIVELQAYDENGENISNGITTTTSSYLSGDTYYWAPLTDGVTSSSQYINEGTGLAWVRLDLGAEYDLSSIRLWHYYTDGRTYYDNEVRVAGEDLVYRTVNNNIYPETSNGLIIRPIPTN